MKDEPKNMKAFFILHPSSFILPLVDTTSKPCGGTDGLD
jgi:hypothetical protein